MLNIRDLSVLGYANGFTLWHYITSDKQEIVRGKGYFNEAADMLRPGDLILANSINDDTAESIMLSVAKISDGLVVAGNLNARPQKVAA